MSIFNGKFLHILKTFLNLGTPEVYKWQAYIKEKEKKSVQYKKIFLSNLKLRVEHLYDFWYADYL